MANISDKELYEIYKRIIDLEEEVKTINNRLDNELRKELAKKEYELMERSRDGYVPPRIPPIHINHKGRNARCDFILIDDDAICDECHFQFELINSYIPPYCPHCFTKREEG